MIAKTAGAAAAAATVSALGRSGLIAGAILVAAAFALLAWILGASSRTRRAVALITAVRPTTTSSPGHQRDPVGK